jgi:dethiobiotin synthetase
MGPKSRIVVIAGTGTEIGKTHVAAALLAAWGKTREVVGYKPIETGVPVGPGVQGEDARRLARASTFHVKHPVFHQTFVDPISPHLAARRARAKIDLDRIARQARDLARVADGVVLELAGGLFTPLGPGIVNADLAKSLQPWRLVLVAPDRLGVLNDVGAAVRAAAAMGLRVSSVVLSAPAVADASTGTNAGEIERVVGVRVSATFPRAKPGAQTTREAAVRVLQALDIVREGGGRPR